MMKMFLDIESLQEAMIPTKVFHDNETGFYIVPETYSELVRCMKLERLSLVDVRLAEEEYYE